LPRAPLHCFQVSNLLIISELTYRAGDACCFVNGAETKGGLTICKEEFDSAPGLVVERVRSQQKEKDGV
jgi:hypothetical protein